jgi:biotin transport system substrate-specific component
MFADRVLPGEGLAWEAARVLTANLLLVVCAQIAVPLPWTPVPVTGQTFGILLVAVLLGGRRGAFVVALYLLEGALGLPVFQPFGAPGALRFWGPTAGYLLAAPVAAYLTGRLAEGWARISWARLSVAVAAGHAIILAGGCAWLAVGLRAGWPQAFLAGVAPFLAGDLIKTALVVATARGAERVRALRA